MTHETWKQIPGYEGRYEVSDAGRVRNARGHVLVPQRINSGYLVVHLMRDYVRKVQLVHRLVAQVFVPRWAVGLCVNHKDLDKQNNCTANLEWVTRSENMLHAVANGRATPPTFAVIGVSIADGVEIHYPSQSAAEKALAGRNSSAVHHCLIGKKKSAYGYTWRRA